MFNFIPPKTITAPIEVTVPGQAAVGTIDFTFVYRPRSVFRAWLAEVAGKEIDADLLAPLITGWNGVVLLGGGDGQVGDPVPFSRDNLATLIESFPTIAVEIYQGYLHAVSESRVKN